MLHKIFTSPYWGDLWAIFVTIFLPYVERLSKNLNSLGYHSRWCNNTSKSPSTRACPGCRLLFQTVNEHWKS